MATQAQVKFNKMLPALSIQKEAAYSNIQTVNCAADALAGVLGQQFDVLNTRSIATKLVNLIVADDSVMEIRDGQLIYAYERDAGAFVSGNRGNF